jgi:hypothetical protein
MLQKAIIAHDGRDSKLAAAVGDDYKGKASAVLYLTAIPLAFVYRWASVAIYAAVACLWLIPDRRIERHISDDNGGT